MVIRTTACNQDPFYECCRLFGWICLCEGCCVVCHQVIICWLEHPLMSSGWRIWLSVSAMPPGLLDGYDYQHNYQQSTIHTTLPPRTSWNLNRGWFDFLYEMWCFHKKLVMWCEEHHVISIMPFLRYIICSWHFFAAKSCAKRHTYLLSNYRLIICLTI